MKDSGVILRKLRELNKLTVKQAAQKTGRSAGWLSEIENGKGAARLTGTEFERLVEVYGGNLYRKQFGLWIAKSRMKVKPAEIEFSGSILKYLRNKVGFTLIEVARELKIAKSYLSMIENGIKPVSVELRNRLLKQYGYSPASFKNFRTEDKRAGNIPTRSKLDLLLRRINEEQVEDVFRFVLQKVSTANESTGVGT